jgi:hypothetical protein
MLVLRKGIVSDFAVMIEEQTYAVDLKRSFVPATEQVAEKEQESDSESVWPPELKYLFLNQELCRSSVCENF